MAFSFDAEGKVENLTCDRCGATYKLSRGFILRDGDAFAVYFAACHMHDGAREAWIDVIFGTWGTETYDDHVSFGCRVGPVENSLDPAATLVQAAIPYENNALWGTKLDRESALRHPRAQDFWDVVDFVLLEDPVVNHHVYHRSPAG